MVTRICMYIHIQYTNMYVGLYLQVFIIYRFMSV